MSHIPPYVFVLMVALLYVGISRCFSRTMRVERLLVLPALMTASADFSDSSPSPAMATSSPRSPAGRSAWRSAGTMRGVGGSASIAADGSSASRATS